jgi:hypothetical protein
MKPSKILLFVCLGVYTNVFAQFDETTFFNRVKSIYHNLGDSETENFSVSVTSDYFEFNAGKGVDHDTYSPIKFRWLSQGSYILIG